ncbi:PAS domain-containing protein [Desulfococcaceae bacterium HSG9]|nr:PAS domain-containing protein [Desulfococcaceae bacterium HSG9]
MDVSKSVPLHIFLVEDDEFDRMAFHRSFKKAGIPHRITECAYANKAFELLRMDASQFDIVVSDYKMPGMNGLELCRKLIEIKISLPIVMLTGTGSEQLAVEALKAGVDDYVVKDPYQGYLELLPIVIPEAVKKHTDALARKRAEKSLRESEEKYRSLITNIPDVTWTSDSQGDTTFVSQNIETIYGYTPKEIYKEGKHLWLDRIHPEDVENVTKAFETLFEKGISFDIEYRIKKKDGKWLWAHNRSIATYEKDGILYADGVFADITERKLADEKLKKSEKLLRDAQHIGSLGHWDWNIDGDTLFWSEEVYRIFGVPPDYFQPSVEAFEGMIHPEDLEEFLDKRDFILRVQKNADIEHRIIRPDGDIRHVVERTEFKLDDEGNVRQVIGIIQDITERKLMDEFHKIALKNLQATEENLHIHIEELRTSNDELLRIQKQLEASHQNYVDLYDFAPVGYFTISASGIILKANITGTFMLGVERSRLIGNPFALFINRDDQKIYHTHIIQLNATQGKQTCEFRLVTKDKSQFHAQIESISLSDENGNLDRIRSVITDITKRKQAEEALQKAHDELERRVDERTAKLQKSETKYRQLIKNIPDIVYKGYKDGSVEFFNGNIELLTGYGSDEFNSKKIKWFDIIVQEHVEVVKECFIQALKTDKFYNREYKIKTKTGDTRWLRDRGYIVCDNDGEIEYVSGAFIDITRTKNLQEQLVRSERLAATGQLAASVAHEINSPLQGITAYLYSIEQSHKHNKELIEDLDLIKVGFERIRDTVQNLLDFNRPGLETKQSVNLNRIITTTASLIQSHLKKQKVKINLNLSPELPEIFGSYQHLGQVFLNLINNAAESIAEIPRPVSERVERLSCRGLVTLVSHYKKDLIIVKVSDTGHGISENDMAHIFDPFYTKKKTKGMGIGLSVCYDIINDHNGTITAENSPEGGAVFIITLPIE